MKIKVQPDIELYVKDIGKGQPILFIHGWPFNHLQYEYQFNRFLELGYRCIAVDMRGAGKSDAPWDSLNNKNELYTYDTFADDIKKIIDHLELKNIILVGFSIGGAMVLHYLAKHSCYKVSKALLLGAAAPLFTKREDFNFPSFDKAGVDKLIEDIKYDRPKAVSDFANNVFHKEISFPFRGWIQQMCMSMDSNATIKWLISLRDFDLRSDMSKVNVPTAIFHGKNDKICPFELGQTLHKNIKFSRLVVFEESGHGLWRDELEKFNTEFINFIKQ